jgi:hypothetical protein
MSSISDGTASSSTGERKRKREESFPSSDGTLQTEGAGDSTDIVNYDFKLEKAAAKVGGDKFVCVSLPTFSIYFPQAISRGDNKAAYSSIKIRIIKGKSLSPPSVATDDALPPTPAPATITAANEASYVFELEKKAAASGGDKYECKTLPTFNIYFPQAISRRGEQVYDSLILVITATSSANEEVAAGPCTTEETVIASAAAASSSPSATPIAIHGWEIIDYSENAFAIVGDGTKFIKGKIQSLGGKFNRGLTVRGMKVPGWVLSKKKYKNEEGIEASLVGKKKARSKKTAKRKKPVKDKEEAAESSEGQEEMEEEEEEEIVVKSETVKQEPRV